LYLLCSRKKNCYHCSISNRSFILFIVGQCKACEISYSQFLLSVVCKHSINFDIGWQSLGCSDCTRHMVSRQFKAFCSVKQKKVLVIFCNTIEIAYPPPFPLFLILYSLPLTLSLLLFSFLSFP